MTYRITIQNPCARDLVITNVSERDVGDTVIQWCGRYSTVTVAQEVEGENK